MDIEPGTVVGGKYRIERPLSRGGMGAVWVGRHVQLDVAVAIKFMDREQALLPDFRARFYREARAVASLESPHVVNVKDYGIEGELPYLVMELLRGEDLRSRLRRVKRLSTAEAARVAAQVARALRRAHEAGLVHRDLKPANLFIAQVDDEEILKVLDFGIVKVTAGALSGETTKTGELLGSPFYMSPEQARGDKDLDARSDLWSLGVILFQSVTGKLPFEGDVLGAVLSKILVEPPPRATALAPDLPPALDAFFSRALARDRAERYPSAPELARAFAAAAGLAAPTSRDGHVTTRSGTVLGLGTVAGSPSWPPSEAASPSSWPAAVAPGRASDGGAPARASDATPGPASNAALGSSSDGGAPGPVPERTRPGTLTSATSVSDARPGQSAARWGLAIVVLLALAGGVAAFLLRGDAPAAPEGLPAAAVVETPAAADPPPPTPAVSDPPLASAKAPPAAATASATAPPAPITPRIVPPRPSASASSTPAPQPSAAPPPSEIVDPWK